MAWTFPGLVMLLVRRHSISNGKDLLWLLHTLHSEEKTDTAVNFYITRQMMGKMQPGNGVQRELCT